jgi:hypothetical protein
VPAVAPSLRRAHRRRNEGDEGDEGAVVRPSHAQLLTTRQAQPSMRGRRRGVCARYIASRRRQRCGCGARRVGVGVADLGEDLERPLGAPIRANAGPCTSRAARAALSRPTRAHRNGSQHEPHVCSGSEPPWLEPGCETLSWRWDAGTRRRGLRHPRRCHRRKPTGWSCGAPSPRSRHIRASAHRPAARQ